MSKDIERVSQQQWMAYGMRSGVVSIPYALLQSYKQLKLSELEVMIILQVMAFQEREHQDFPTLDELQARLSAPPNQVIPAIQRLIKAQYIAIDEAIDERTGVQYEKYNLQQLYEKLAEHLIEQAHETAQSSGPVQSSASAYASGSVTSSAAASRSSVPSAAKSPMPLPVAETPGTGKDIYSIMEREFGRPLTPMEFETISAWIDKDRYHQEVILAALKEAVFAGKLNFRYIDRILLDWARHQITTAEMAKTYSQQFRQSR